MLANLDDTKRLGLEIKEALEAGDTPRFAALMDEHWQRKRKRSDEISNESIDRWYQVGVEAGAAGGKLVGAGRGGFLLFYAKDPRQVRAAMAAEGLVETRFTFDLDGSVVLVRE